MEIGRKWRLNMTLRIGDLAPDFEAQTTEGRIRFHEWIGDSWCVLFSHPKDFTPVCTTELGYMARIKPEFDKRNVKIIGLSVDPVDNHAQWAEDIRQTHRFDAGMTAAANSSALRRRSLISLAQTMNSEARAAAGHSSVTSSASSPAR